jgi:hypothetical protein
VLGNLSKKGKSKIPCSSMSLQSQDLFLQQERYKVIRNYAAHSLEFSGEALATATPVLVLPRLGYGWLGSAFDGFEADTKTGKPSRR